jgi:hypothetical protein
MRMKKAVLALLVGGVLLPSGVFAGRLEGLFSTTQEGTDGTNEACIEADGRDFGVDGGVSATSGNCTCEMFYETSAPHKAAAKALKEGKTEGTASVSQSIFTAFFVEVFGEGCTEAFFGFVDVEKCKANAKMKGTSGSPDTLDSATIKASCELGENGGNIDTDLETAGVQAPTPQQYEVCPNAFEGRSDVNFSGSADKNVNISQKGVADSTDPFCGD